ncbi:MAG: PKD domain-containing protein, partial [bacterium]|nr:PKD domain-containing protein [bacterium]
DGKISSYEWTFSDGLFPAKSSQTTRRFKTPGIYGAKLVVTDDSGATNSHAQDSISIHINHRPSAKTSVSHINTCDSSIVFDASASVDPDGDPLQYRWNFGDGTSEQAGPVVVHTYKKGGKYPVVLKVNDGSGLTNAVGTASIHVNINRRPRADAGKDRTVCAGEIVLFDAQASSDPGGGSLRYLWDFGKDSKAEGLNPAKIFKNGGIYKVSLTVEDGSGLPCNTDTDQMILNVAEAPVADAGPDQRVCANTLVGFDGSGSRDFDGIVNAYSWDFGDGTTGGGKNPTHVYEMPGTYRVALTITGDRIGNCNNTNSDEMTVSVFEAPLASFTGLSMVPAGTPVLFDASMSSVSKHGIAESVKIVSKTWDFGDGSTGEGEKVSHVYEKHGNYFVNLTVTTDSQNECNNSSVKKPLTVNASPVAEAGEDMEASLFYQVVFDGSGSEDPDGAITGYLWDFGDGKTGSGIQARHSYKSPGKYAVKLTVTDNTALSNNKASDTLSVRVNDPPKPVIDLAKEVFCPKEEILFDGQKSQDTDGGIISWKWNFGDGTTGEEKAETNKVSHVYGKPGIYSATLTVDDGSPVSNRVAVWMKKIIVNQAPIADAGPDRKVCPGEKVEFDASLSNDNDGKITGYTWNFGDETVAQGKKAVHQFEKPGTYKVLLRITDDSGSDCSMGEDTVIVFVNSSPVADAGPDRKVFTGGAHDAVLFDGTKSIDPDKDSLTYTWDFGDSTTQTGPVVLHYFRKPGSYKVRLLVDDGSKTACQSGWDEAIIVVKAR